MTAAGHSNVKPIIVQGHSRPLTMVKYNREGDLLFTAAKDHRPCVWYADNGERIGTFDGHQGTVWALDVNFASTHLLTAGADNHVKLWNVQTGECLHTWKHTGPVRDVRFALGDRRFLTVLDNIMGNVPTIFVWDLELHNLANHPDCPTQKMLGHTMKVTRALWGPLNRSIFSSGDDATIRVWNPESGEQKGAVEGEHTKRITDMQLSWDMTFLVTSCGDFWVRLFETSSLTLLKKFNTERNINTATISPLAACPYLIAAGGQDAMSVTTTAAKQGNFHASFYDHVFDDELGKVEGHFGPVRTPERESAPRNARARSAARPRPARAARAPPRTADRRPPAAQVNTLAFAPHGRSYTSGGEEGYVRIHHLPPAYFEAFERKVAEAHGKPYP